MQFNAIPLRLLTTILLLLTSHIQPIQANTEKVIFLGPSPITIPLEHPTLSDLHLEALSPQYHTLRTHIEASFPTPSSENGQSTWYLLHRLAEGQRYEVRICWSATVRSAPTLFSHYKFPFSGTISVFIKLIKRNINPKSRNQPHFDLTHMIQVRFSKLLISSLLLHNIQRLVSPFTMISMKIIHPKFPRRTSDTGIRKMMSHRHYSYRFMQLQIIIP